MKNLTEVQVRSVSGGGFSDFMDAVEKGLEHLGHVIHDLLHGV